MQRTQIHREMNAAISAKLTAKWVRKQWETYAGKESTWRRVVDEAAEPANRQAQGAEQMRLEQLQQYNERQAKATTRNAERERIQEAEQGGLKNCGTAK